MSSFSTGTPPMRFVDEIAANTTLSTPTFLPTTFLPASANNSSETTENDFETLPTRIAICKRKRTTAPSEQNKQSIQGSNDRNNNTIVSISRSTHLQTPILFETGIVDAPTNAQRRGQRVVTKLESTEETDDEENEQRITLVETRPPTPIERIAFYVEKHVRTTQTPDWRKMHLTARRLRSLTARVFPVLHLLTIGVYWSGRTNQEAFVHGGALFFNAAALCVCSDLHLFLSVCRALCITANQDVFTCIEAHYDAFRRWQQDAARDHNDDDDDDIKIDIEFEALFEEYTFRK
jgi:hypothetical protein